MALLTVIVVLILTPVVLVTAFFSVEVLAGLSPLRTTSSSASTAQAAIIVPAHNEECDIAETVRGLVDAAPLGAIVVVIADNCTDDTASLARAAGAEVAIRNEPDRRGKGFALAAAREWLQSDPPDVVLIIDADCSTDAPSLAALAAAAVESGRPCQAINLLAPDLTASPMVQISNFAFLIKNLFRQRGLQRLARRAHLTGTGMAIPWSIFATSELGGSNIVEDLALGLDLASQGLPPSLNEGARVWSKAAGDRDTLGQRRRWEGGYVSTALQLAPRALGRSIRAGDVRGLWAALDLSVPPLALLVMLNGLAFIVCVAGVGFGVSFWPLAAQFAVGAAASVALCLAWAREGRRFVSIRSLLRSPFYILWKLPLYAGLVRRGAPKEWLRTER